MQIFAVVYFPVLNSEEINEFRHRYDPGWKIIKPHITLVSPLSDISEESLITHLETITNEIKSFPIVLSGLLKSFDDYLFLQVKEGHEAIVNLHDKLYSGVLASYIPTDIPFSPHITLGEFRTKDDTFDDKRYAKAYAEAQDLHFNITCDFDALSLIKGDGLSPAILVKTIPLLKNDITYIAR